MNPVCFYIGSRPIYWYGVMMASAFLACMAHWTILGRKEGRGPAFGSDLAVWLMLSGIAGARVAYVLANLGEFSARPWDIIRLDKGGLVFFGGFLAACAAVVIFARSRHERLWPIADFAISAIPLGHALGRIGCFINGCCYGTVCAAPWAIESHGAARHPVQLYEAVLNMAIYFVLLIVYFRKIGEGRVFALYLLLYPTVRFMLEFLRGDERIRFHGLSLAQYVCLALFAAGAAAWFLAPGRRKSQK